MTGTSQYGHAASGIAFFACFLFCVAIFLSVAAVNWNIGPIPIRSLFISAALLILILSSPHNFAQSVLDNAKIYWLLGLAAIIGFLVSIFNQSDLLLAGRQILEIHIQAAVGFTLTTLLIGRFGIAAVLSVLLAVWALSAIAAIAQFSDIGLAWEVRGFWGAIMEDPDITRAFYTYKMRALGLSFTPVHLASQTCLVFAVFFAYRIYQTSGMAWRRLDPPIIGAVLIALIVCVISGNRSPLLGFGIFALLYFIFASPRLSAAILPLIAVVIAAGFAFLDPSRLAGLRVTDISDGSAIGRTTLIAYGIYLFFENPLGYGLLFDSRIWAEGFMHQAMTLPNTEIIRYFTLHNYYLQLLNKYGILILALIPLIFPRNRNALVGWAAFLPYLIHIFFHNAGPLSADFLFWFCLPAVIAATAGRNRAGRNANAPAFQIATPEAKPV